MLRGFTVLPAADRERRDRRGGAAVKDTVTPTVVRLAGGWRRWQGTAGGALMFLDPGMPTSPSCGDNQALWPGAVPGVVRGLGAGRRCCWRLQGHWGKAAIPDGWASRRSAPSTTSSTRHRGDRLRLNTPTALLAFLGGWRCFSGSGVPNPPSGPRGFSPPFWFLGGAVTLALMDIWRLRTWPGRAGRGGDEKEAEGGREGRGQGGRPPRRDPVGAPS